MEERWKSLFPKTGSKTKSSGGISDDSSSAGDSDGGKTRGKGTRKANPKAMVDIAEEDDSTAVSLLSGEDTGQLANSKQQASRAAGRTVPETAPPEDPQEEWPFPSSSSSYRRPKAKKTAISSSTSSINARSSGKAPWDGEPTTGQRRWRTQARSTEPASSSRAGRRARDSVVPSSSEEEEEEEFDESEANITGHERNNSRSPIPRPRERKHGGGADESTPYSNKKGKGSGCSPGGGTSASPYGGASPSRRQRHEEEIESSGSESCGEFSNSDFDGSEGAGRKPSSSSRRLSSSSSLSRRREGEGEREREGEGKWRTNGGGTKGRVVREGGRRRKGSSSHSRMSSNPSAIPIPGSAEGVRARSAPSGSKKARKGVRAQGDEQGWIAKGGGSGGGGSGGSGGRARNPVLSFHGPQASIRKNSERSLTQSKLNFPLVVEE
ncbi:unnamed protein product [Ectocarpus fasciculatus]